MIKPIYLKALRNAEYLEFMKLYLELIKGNDPTKLKVDAHFVMLTNLFNEAEALFKLPQDSILTGYLLELDINRDKALIGIARVINGYKNHFDKAHVEAANFLARNLKTYGPGIYQLNYQAESSTITSIITDWETDSSLTSAVTKLGLADWKKHLKETNVAFFNLYTKRLQETGGQINDNLYSKRGQITEAYNNMSKLLEVQAFIGNPADYEKTFNEINALVDKYNILLETRKSKKKDEEENEGETPTV